MWDSDNSFQHYNNLTPFKKGEANPNRQNGRRKGQISRKTIVKNILSSKMNPSHLLTPNAQAIYEQIPNKSYLDGVVLAVINSAMSGNVHAANTLLKIVGSVEDKEPSEDSIYNKGRIEFVIMKETDVPDYCNKPIEEGVLSEV